MGKRNSKRKLSNSNREMSRSYKQAPYSGKVICNILPNHWFILPKFIYYQTMECIKKFRSFLEEREHDMTQQTFPVGRKPRVVISQVEGNLTVRSWKEQMVSVQTDG